jgi:dienelactone hydrolase
LLASAGAVWFTVLVFYEELPMNENSGSRRDFLAALAAATGGSLLAGSADAAVPADRPRELPETGADLGSLFADVEKAAGDNRYAHSFADGKFRTLADFHATARPKVFELLLHRPDKVEPQAEVIERVDRDDHIRERIIFSTTPQFRVPAYVLIPKNLKKPAPGIVDLHSHGGMFLFGKEKVIDLGDNHAAMGEYHQRNYEGRPTATALVQRGYVVISIDAFFFGERRLMMDADRKSGWDRSKYTLDDVKRLNQQCRAKEGTLAKAMVFAGLTWPGIVAWDDIRTVDYLVTRPEVDAKRIGCLGVSMGGHRSANLAALDERITAACVAGFMSTVAPMRRKHLDTHSWVHFLPGLHRWLDLPDLVSLAAPRALMVLQCSRDQLFPSEGMKQAVTKIASVYEKAGVKEKFAGRFYDEPHIFSKAMQDDAFAWLDRHLK